MLDLKPCPFCGYKPMIETITQVYGKMYILKCSNYSCIKSMDTYPVGYDLEDVIKKWNKRTKKEEEN